MASNPTPPLSFFDLSSLPYQARVLDFAILVMVIAAVIVWETIWKNNDKSEKGSTESEADFQHRRGLGAGAVQAQLSTGLSSASILAAGAFALLGLTRVADSPTPTAVSTQVVIGVIWLVISMLIGVWNSGVMTVKVATKDASGLPSINIMLVAQLWSIVAGGFTILMSLFLIG